MSDQQWMLAIGVLALVAAYLANRRAVLAQSTTTKAAMDYIAAVN
jgi:hypothetical protein